MGGSRDRGRAGKRAPALEPKRTGSKFQLRDSVQLMEPLRASVSSPVKERKYFFKKMCTISHTVSGMY